MGFLVHLHAFTCVPMYSSVWTWVLMLIKGKHFTELSSQPLKWIFKTIFVFIHYYHQLESCRVNNHVITNGTGQWQIVSCSNLIVYYSWSILKEDFIVYFHTQFLIPKVVFISSCYHFLDNTYKSKGLLTLGGLCIPIIPNHRRQRQEGHYKLKTSLIYIISFRSVRSVYWDPLLMDKL